MEKEPELNEGSRKIRESFAFLAIVTDLVYETALEHCPASEFDCKLCIYGTSFYRHLSCQLPNVTMMDEDE